MCTNNHKCIYTKLIQITQRLKVTWHPFSYVKQIKHEIKTKMVVTSQGTGSDRYMKGSNFLAKGNLEGGFSIFPVFKTYRYPEKCSPRNMSGSPKKPKKNIPRISLFKSLICDHIVSSKDKISVGPASNPPETTWIVLSNASRPGLQPELLQQTSKPGKKNQDIPSGKQTWPWKIPSVTRKYIFKLHQITHFHFIFRLHISLPECSTENSSCHC